MRYIVVLFLFLTCLVADHHIPEYLSDEEKKYISQKKVILVSNEFDYEPYDFYKNEKAKGYSVDLLNLLTKKVGLEVKYVTKPWNQLLDDLDSNKLDLVHTAFKTKERLTKYRFSKGYLKILQRFVINIDSKDIGSIEALYGKKVGVTKGWAEEEYFNQFPQVQKVYFKNLKEKLKALSLGQIDAISEDENIARYNIIKFGYRNIKISNSLDKNAEYSINNLHFISPINQGILVSILDKAYSSLSLQDIQAIRSKWFGDNNKNNILSDKEKYYLQENVFNVYVGNWEPFTIQSPDKLTKPKGLSVEVWEKVAKDFGIQFNYIQYDNFHSALKELKNDALGVHLATAPTTERLQYGVFTTPYEFYPVAIVTTIDKNFMPTLELLKGKKIAVGKNFTAHKILEENYHGIEFIFVNNTYEALDLVANGKAYAAADILPVIVNAITNNHYHNLKISGASSSIFELSMMVNKDSKEFINILNKIFSNFDDTYMKQVNNRWLATVKHTKEVDYFVAYILLGIIFIIIIWFVYNRQKLLAKLQVETERFAMVIEGTDEGIFDWDIQTNQVYLSPQWKKLLGYRDSELENSYHVWENKVHHEDLADVMGTINDFLSGKTNSFEAVFRMQHKDGRWVWINAKAVKSVDEHGKAKRMVGSHTDITELVEYRNDLEEKVNLQLKQIRNKDVQLMEQSKMASMGQMIGNIAHQWRQPLTLISTLSTGSIFEKETGILDDKKFITNMNVINDQAQYLSRTIDTFRDFIKEKKEYKNVLLEDRINIALGIISSSLENHYIELINTIDYSEAINIRVLSGELVEVIINIMNNAKDVLLEKDIQDPWIKIDVESDGVDAVITIEDNGGGIPLDVMPYIFEPYYTTKHESQGTGLGLHMAYKIIVDHHQGKLYAKNTQYGAKFFIVLPIINK